jgi:adiponectin receptor
MGVLYGGMVYIGGAAILSLRVPEKFFPRTFDLVGASHNIWHLAVLTGCAWHFITAVWMYEERQSFVCPINIPS